MCGNLHLPQTEVHADMMMQSCDDAAGCQCHVLPLCISNGHTANHQSLYHLDLPALTDLKRNIGAHARISATAAFSNSIANEACSS